MTTALWTAPIWPVDRKGLSTGLRPPLANLCEPVHNGLETPGGASRQKDLSSPVHSPYYRYFHMTYILEEGTEDL